MLNNEPRDAQTLKTYPYDEPSIAQTLKIYLYDQHRLNSILTDDLLVDFGLSITDEYEFEIFISVRFKINIRYVIFHQHRTFSDLVRHIHLMLFYRHAIKSWAILRNGDFNCLIANGYKYEVHTKKPSIFRRIKAFFKDEKFIYPDFVH